MLKVEKTLFTLRSHQMQFFLHSIKNLLDSKSLIKLPLIDVLPRSSSHVKCLKNISTHSSCEVNAIGTHERIFWNPWTRRRYVWMDDFLFLLIHSLFFNIAKHTGFSFRFYERKHYLLIFFASLKEEEFEFQWKKYEGFLFCNVKFYSFSLFFSHRRVGESRKIIIMEKRESCEIYAFRKQFINKFVESEFLFSESLWACTANDYLYLP